MIAPGVAVPIVTMSEWSTKDLPGVYLTSEDRSLVLREKLGHDGRVTVDEMRDGVRITSRSWVGVLRFQGFELRIVPKFVEGNLGLVRMLEYSSGLEVLRRYLGKRKIAVDGDHLLDLVALLFVESCERLMKSGFLADYREVEDDLPVLRGRLLVRRQILKRFSQIDRLECRFDEQVTDIIENQILSAAMDCCARRITDARLRLRARQLQGVLRTICSLDQFDVTGARSEVTYHRLNDHYSEPHVLAWYVLDGMGIRDLFQHGRPSSFVFLLDMNRLFEAFIGRWLADALRGAGYRLEVQKSDRSIIWDLGQGKPYSRVRPDVLIQVEGQRGMLPVDAKYKKYDEQALNSGDVYQCFLYAFAYSGGSERRVPRALILYPATGPTFPQRILEIRDVGGLAGANIASIGIHVPTALKEAQGKAGELTCCIRELVAGWLPMESRHPMPIEALVARN